MEIQLYSSIDRRLNPTGMENSSHYNLVDYGMKKQKKCPECKRVMVSSEDHRGTLQNVKFTYEPIDPEALPICPDCEDKLLSDGFPK